MITFLFWNLYGRQKKKQVARMEALRASVARLTVRHGIDVILLAECEIAEGDIIQTLNAAGVGTYHRPASRSRRIQLFSRLPQEVWTDAFDDPTTNRLTMQWLKVGSPPGILLAGIHFPDRMSVSPGAAQLDVAQDIATDIRRIEDTLGRRRTVLVGDLNMNPFEDGMAARKSLHAVMSRNLAATIHKRKDRADYPCFYNPMWAYFGDYAGGPPGTYYYSNKDANNRFWNIYDQVLVRPELVDSLSHVEILDGDGESTFVTKRGVPRKAVFSDHLPLLFRLNL
jgi:hypothetical protein